MKIEVVVSGVPHETAMEIVRQVGFLASWTGFDPKSEMVGVISFTPRDDSDKALSLLAGVIWRICNGIQ